jgi:hypothetical protein
MKLNLKKLVGAAAIAGAMGLPAIGVGAGAANAATPVTSTAGQVEITQTTAGQSPAQVQPVDWHGGHGRWGDHDDWGGGHRGWGHGGWGWGWPGGWSWRW